MLHQILTKVALYLPPSSREFPSGQHDKGSTPSNLKIVEVDAVPKPRRQIDSPCRVGVIKEI